jgi:hypothetical protein
MIQEAEKISTTKVLVDALHLELNEIQNSLLLLFSFVYDKDKMLKAKSAFNMKKREGVANALEVIEIEVPKEISLKFNKIFEPGTIADKCNAMQVYFKEHLTYEKIMDDILNNHHHHYHRWTRAAALLSINFYTGAEKRGWLEKAQTENDILLYQTAENMLSKLN